MAAIVAVGAALAGCGAVRGPARTIAAVARTSAGAGAACGHDAPHLTVHGTGQATGTPDLLTVQFQISVTRPSASTALASDNAKAAAVLAALVRGGVDRADIQTTGLTIQPNYVSSANGIQRLTGYQVVNSVTAKVHHLGRAGATVDAISRAGGDATVINGLAFSVNDARSLDSAARVDAVHQARARARAMAGAAGERLGPVCSLTDQSPNPPPIFPTPIAGTFRSAAPAQSVPLEAGSQQVSAQVTLVYALQTG